MAEDQAVRNEDNEMSDAKMEDDVEVIASTEPNGNGVAQKQVHAEGEEEDGDVDAQLEKYKERLKIVEQQSQQLKSDSATGDGTVPAADSGVPGSDASGITMSDSGVLGLADSGASAADNEQAIAAVDARSVYVGNVDYGATVQDLGEHFSDCGAINRVTIMCNKATGMPKGFAYIEFTEPSSVKHATILDGTTFRERKLKVVAKRTNIPGLSYRGRGRPRYRGRGRGRGRRGFRGRGWAPY